ncbi:cohesin domain-containing protein [Halovivax cerinus]|uniref:Cohesin domain-containing protein n=1 Tax=Halovivax cerinus TaxID=1487865 RepID=A0ABD5NP13_9EURY|nr:cohesin domain-containing protein [Halovivax cerinus]
MVESTRLEVPSRYARCAVLLCAVLLVVCGAVLVPAASAHGGGSQAAIERAASTDSATEIPTLSLAASEGTDGGVSVSLETDAAVAGYQANVTFDPSVLVVDDVSGVDMADPVVNVDNENGWVFFTQSQATAVESPTLARIDFESRSAGETDVSFVTSDTRLNDESERVRVDLAGTSVDVDTDSTEDVTAEPAAFEYEPTELPTESVEAGTSVEIPVEVSNVGGTTDNYEVTLWNGDDSLATETELLSGGESATVQLTHTFTTPGTYDLSVNDENVGQLEVTGSESNASIPGFGVIGSLLGLSSLLIAARARRVR